MPLARSVMNDSQLTTAKYLEQFGDDTKYSSFDDASPVENQPVSSANSSGGNWALMTKWLSVGVGGLLVICVAVLAVPYITGLHGARSGNPVDWMLWLGGAKSDQTLNNYLLKSSTDMQSQF